MFEQATSNSKGGSGRRALPGATRRRARSLLWISQLKRTKANVNLERLERFEGGVVSACAPLRRCAAAPLRRCAAAPLRRAPLRSYASLASRSPRALASRARLFDFRVYRGRRAARYISSRTMRFVGGWSATPPPTACTVHAYVHASGRFVSCVVQSKKIKRDSRRIGAR